MTIVAAHETIWNERLQDLADGVLPPEGRALVEAHVATCDACRQQLASLRRLDEFLALALPAPRLGAEFDARILQSVADGPSAGSIAGRRSQFELEHRSRLDSLRRGLRQQWRSSIPDLIAGGAVLAAALPILERAVAAFASLTASLSPSMPPLVAGPGVAVAVTAVLTGVAFAVRWQRSPG
jgi:anti-sigma factor RsiW